MKQIKLLSTIVLVLIILTGIGMINLNNTKIRLDKNGYYISDYAKMSSKQWESLDVSSTRFESPEEFLLEIDENVEAIATLIGREDWQNVLKKRNGNKFDTKIEVEFTYAKYSKAIGGGAQKSFFNAGITPKVKLSRSSLNGKYEVIAHELTHILSPSYESISLSEGLCCYVNTEVGKGTSGYPTKTELHITALEFIDKDELFKQIGNVRKDVFEIYFSYESERHEFYVLSTSFAAYLINEYGMEKYMELLSSDDTITGYIEVYGSTFDAIKSEWKTYVKNI